MYNHNSKRVSVLCPKCGRATKTKIVPGITRVINFPLWCERCKSESIVNIGRQKSHRPESQEPSA